MLSYIQLEVTERRPKRILESTSLVSKQSHDMLNKIDRRVNLRDGYVIFIWSEEQISTNNDNLPTKENLPVPQSGSQ